MNILKRNYKKIIVIISCLILFCVVGIGFNSNYEIKASTTESSSSLSLPEAQTTNNYSPIGKYEGYDIENLMPFKEYAQSLGYSFNDASTSELFTQNFF